MRDEPFLPSRAGNPLTREATRRQTWRQITLPFALGVLLLILLVVLLWRGAVASASAWADASLVLLILPLLCGGVLLLALLIAAAVGIGYLGQVLPPPAQRAQDALANTAGAIRRGGDQALRPLLVLQSIGEAVRQVFRIISSLLGR